MTPVLSRVIAVMMTVTLPVVLIGALSVEMRDDIGFGSSALGLAVTCHFLTSAVVSTWCGRLVERLGWRNMMRAAAAIGALACAGIAVSDGLPLLMLFVGVSGIAAALAHPATNALIIERVPHFRRGLAFGIKQTSIPAGTAFAGLAVPIVALTVGWRWAFVAGALLAALTVLAVPTTTHLHRAPGATTGRLPRDGRQLLIALAVAAALGSASSMSLPAFLTTSAVARGISAGTAGVLLTGGSICGLAVRLIVGARADRRATDHVRVIGVMLLLGAIGLLGLASSRPVVFAIATVVAFGTGWAWQGLFTHVITGRWPAAPAAATGVAQTGIYVGGVVGPTLFGWLTSTWSDVVGWLVLSAMMASATVVIVVVRRRSAIGAF